MRERILTVRRSITGDEEGLNERNDEEDKNKKEVEGEIPMDLARSEGE